MILPVVMVFVATVVVVVVVVVMFVDESLTGTLVDVEVFVWVLGLLSYSNCCQAYHTAKRTELHPF